MISKGFSAVLAFLAYCWGLCSFWEHLQLPLWKIVQAAMSLITCAIHIVIPQTLSATTTVATRTTYVQPVVTLMEGIVVADVAHSSITAVRAAIPNTMLVTQTAGATVSA